MKALRGLKDKETGELTLPVPVDFLTTVTANTFRKSYYFDKRATTVKAVEVHQKYAKDSGAYLEMVMRTLPVMLNGHKILSALFIFDSDQPAETKNKAILSILTRTRPDMVPDFWLTFFEFGEELGLKKKSLGQMGRKLVWRYVNAKVERQGMRRVAMQLLKDKKRWNEVFYKAHAHMEGIMEMFVGHILFGRELDYDNEALYVDGVVSTTGFLKDQGNIAKLSAKKELTLKDIESSWLPFRTLEGYASQVGIKTGTAQFYDAAFERMTAYEKLRRTDAMLRCGFISDNLDRWAESLKGAARVYDPVDVASVILQHPQLRDHLIQVLEGSLRNSMFKFPEGSVVLVDGSRSMKLVRRNARPRCIWELVGLIAAVQGRPTFIVRDTVKEFDTQIGGALGIATAFGKQEAYNPTNLAAGLVEAHEYAPEWVFVVTDGQDNLPYRGAAKVQAEKMEGTIVTLNPTINPLEPEASTGIGSKNEVLLPIRGIRFLKNMMEVIT